MHEDETGADRQKLHLIAGYLGYELDELGNPFRRVQQRDPVTGELYQGVADFDPLADNGDSFLVLVELGLNLEEVPGRAFFCCDHCRGALVGHEVPDLCGPEQRQASARRAVFDCAAKVVGRLYSETALKKG